MSGKIRVLYVFKHHRSFINCDFEMLSNHFDVSPFYFCFKTFFKLPYAVLKSDVVFVWFVSYHAFFASVFSTLFEKKLVVVTGGYDVAGEDEIKYGLMRNRVTRCMVRFVLKRSSKILAVSEFNKKEIIRHLGLKKNIELIINSVDSKEFYPDDSIEKESLVLTVGFIKNETLKRKGLETFVRAAEYVPHARFLLIGKAKDDGSLEYLQSLASDNVEFLGFVSDKELLRLYQRAKVYCQLSYYESFGVAVVESMLCECVPVVTNKGALSEVAKDVGFFVTYGDVKTTVSAIKKALVSDKGIEARKRAIEVFSIERREQELKEIIDLCYKD